MSSSWAKRGCGGRRLSARARRVLWALALGVPTIVLAVATVRSTYGYHDHRDFHIFWQAGRDVLSGRSPYPSPTAAAMRNHDQFVYPAPAALLMVPFALLSQSAAGVLFMVLNTIAIVLALRLLEVRDWRCYGLTLCSIATLQGIVLGEVTALLLLGLACAWRWRTRRWRAAATVAGMIVLKLFLLPLLVWLVAGGRRLTALVAVAVAATLAFAGWSVVGFHSLWEYPQLLSTLDRLEQSQGYSLTALASGFGASQALARAFGLVVTAALCAAVVLAFRRAQSDRGAFAIAVVASLALSPVLWLNNLLLLVAPLAILRPRFSSAWGLLPLSWLFASANHAVPVWKIAAFQATVTAVLWLALRGRGQTTESAELEPTPSRPAHATGLLAEIGA